MAKAKVLEAVEGEVEWMSAKAELVELARAYLAEDVAEKGAKDRKALMREPIMELISEVVREEVPLARKTLNIPREEIDGPFGGDIRLWLQMKFPEWTIDSVVTTQKAYEIEIAENDALVKYEFEVDGYKFGRTITRSSPVFDGDGLHEDPEFLGLGAEDILVETTIYELDERRASRYLAENPDSAPIFARHTQPGKVAAKLLPFQPLKEEG